MILGVFRVFWREKELVYWEFWGGFGRSIYGGHEIPRKARGIKESLVKWCFRGLQDSAAFI